MSDSLRTQVRHAFTVPALLLVYAVIALGSVVYLGSLVLQSVHAGRAVDSFRLCERVSDQDCLTAIDGGDLRGPFNQRRSVNDKWRMVSGGFADTFYTSSSDSDRIPGSDTVAVYAYRGSVAVIVTDTDEVRPLYVGARGAVERACWALAVLGAAVGSVRYALRKRRTWGGWLAMRGPSPEGRDLVTVLLLGPGLVAGGGMSVLGLPWPAAVVAGLLVGAAMVYPLLHRPMFRR